MLTAPYPAPQAVPGGAIERVRAALAGAGYAEGRIGELVGAGEFPAAGSVKHRVALERSRRMGQFGLLARLLVLCQPVEESELGGELARDLCALGLAERHGATLAPRTTVVELDGHWLAADPPVQLRPEAAADSVNGPTIPTAELLRFAVRRRSRATLDLGTGCGLLALAASHWSDRSAASDVNARALEFTRFNAALNGVEAVECFCGDLFAPLAGQRFDSILSNPPFLITPGQRMIYRDSGMAGDGFAQRVVREAAPVLDEGGMLQMIFEWVHPQGQDAEARLRSWFDGLGCDAWVFRTSTIEPAQYAVRQIEATEHPDRFEAALDEWLDYYRRQGYAAFSGGLLAMRRRHAGGANWFEMEDMPGGAPEALGTEVERRFAVRDFVERHGESVLLRVPLQVDQSARLIRTASIAVDGIHVEKRELGAARQSFAAGLSPSLETLLSRLDGETPAAALLEQAGAGDRVARQLIPFLREMLLRGLLRSESITRG